MGRRCSAGVQTCGATDAAQAGLDAQAPDAAGMETDHTCADGASRVCACGMGQVGRRDCVEGHPGGECKLCPAADDAKVASLCVAGRYVGRYDVPKYLPAAAGFCGLFTLFGGPGTGAWAFSIGDSPNAGQLQLVGAESCLEFTVEGDGGVPEPVRMALTGTLDCATGKLSGEVRGVYHTVSLCNAGTMLNYYPVKGFVTATFDPKTQSFADGVVDLREPSSGLGTPAGGKGTWEARLDLDAAVPPPVADCLNGAPFMDFEVKP